MQKGPGPKGPGAMLDANRDGRIDAVELGRLIDKLQAVRSRIGDGGISLEAFRDEMMAGPGKPGDAQPKKPQGDMKRNPPRDKDKAAERGPERPGPRDERERPRDGRRPQQRGREG